MAHLHRAVDKKLEAHQDPVDVEQHDCYAKGQKVGTYEEMVDVVLV
jgi:hypothetical protein